MESRNYGNAEIYVCMFCGDFMDEFIFQFYIECPLHATKPSYDIFPPQLESRCVQTLVEKYVNTNWREMPMMNKSNCIAWNHFVNGQS